MKMYTVIKKNLTFDVKFNDLALTTSNSIESLTAISSGSCSINPLKDKATVGQNDTISRVVVQLFVLQRK